MRTLFSLMLAAACLTSPLTGQTVEGLVFESETSAPVPGALVRLLSPALEALAEVRSDDRGRFSIVAPEPGTYVLMAEAPGFAAAPEIFELATGQDLSVILSLSPLPGVQVRSSPLDPESQSADLLGRVTERGSGRPIEGALVTLVDRDKSVLSNEAGRFLMIDQAPGLTRVRIEHLAFGTQEKVIDLNPGWAFELSVALDESAIEVEGIEVTVRSRPAARALQPVFERMDRGVGGYFVERKTLEQAGYPSLARAVGRMPGVRVCFLGPGRVTVTIRGTCRNPGCDPALYVDGQLVRRPGTPPDPLYTLSTMDVEIIEVYSSAASLPADFWHSGVTCAVAVWTKRGG